MRESAVSVVDLWKRYENSEAVRGVSFEIELGHIFGLLGPNGAGKTTTLECILGLRKPDRGSIRIHGHDVRSEARKAKLLTGAQLQSASLQDQITPREALDLFGSFYDNPFSPDDLLRRFGLEAKAGAAFSTLSGGMRQRLFLALAMVNRPAVLVLDEPTAGLDPRARGEFRALIAATRAEGGTVLLSTHDLDEANELCDRVAIMDAGRIVVVAPPSELVARASAKSRVVVRTSPALSRSVIESLGGVSAANATEIGWTLETSEPTRLMAQVARRAEEQGVKLVDLELRRPSLEDAFLELTGRAWPADDAGAAP